MMPSPPVPPSTFRAIRLITGVAVRRRINRIRGNIAAGFSRRKKTETPERRTGTAKKGGAGNVVLFFMAIIFLFNGTNISTQFFQRLGERIDFLNSFVVQDFTYLQIKTTAEQLKLVEESGPESDSKRMNRENLRGQLRKAFGYEIERHGISEEQQTVLTNRMMVAFDERGVAAFRERPPRGPLVFWPSTVLWVSPENSGQILNAVGGMLALLGVSMFFMTLGTMNQDLGKVEWSMEWLFTLPVPARTLFLAKMAELVVANPLMWFCTMPFTFVLFYCAGFGWWSVVLAVVIATYLAVLLAAFHVVIETWLRKTLAVNQLKNIQAIFTLVGIILFFVLMAVAASPAALPYLVEYSASASDAAMWNPLSVPILLCSGVTNTMLAAAGAMLGCALCFPLAGIAACQWLVSDGLLSTGGAYIGRRGGSAALKSGGRLHGIVGKEVRLLFRDRNFLVQALIVPVLIIGFQVLLNPDVLKGAAADMRHASMLAFGLGAYVLAFSAFQVLAVEGPALWMLYTLPRDLSKILIDKTALWCGFSLLYTVIALLGFSIYNHQLSVQSISPMVAAIVGVMIYSYIASGIGVLGTDPLQTEVNRKIKPEMFYLYGILVSMYAWAIYSPSVWSKLAQMILSTLLAASLWQKVRDNAPYMLDPAQDPPPQIGLADGMVAVIAFFVLQSLISVVLVLAKVPASAVIFIAFVSAGLLVALFALYIFWRQKVPNILASVGLRREPGEIRASYARALLFGLTGGLVAAGFAMIYLWMATWFEPLKQLKEESLKLVLKSEPDLYWWIAVLAVVAAPLFEEFIFRGLVYRGLRRSVKPYVAILASAGVFAIVHPPLSVIPVFGLGLAAAISFEYSQLLLAPIIAHAVYNFIVVAVQ